MCAQSETQGHIGIVLQLERPEDHGFLLRLKNGKTKMSSKTLIPPTGTVIINLIGYILLLSAPVCEMFRLVYHWQQQ